MVTGRPMKTARSFLTSSACTRWCAGGFPSDGTGTATVVRRMTAVVVAACAIFGVSCSSASTVASPARNADVLLVPDLNAGAIGWCVITGQDGICPTRPADRPIIVQQWVVHGEPPVARGYALTKSDITAVAVGRGAPIPTHREAKLPADLRAVVVEVPAVRDQTTGESGYRAPRFVPLNQKGQRVKESVEAGSPLASFATPTESVTDSSHPMRGLCNLEASSLRGLKVGGRQRDY